MANEEEAKYGGGMPSGAPSTEKDSLTKMFVGGIDLNTTEETFRSHFAQYGQIIDSVIIRDQFKKPRGFGFITYADPREVDVALDNRPHNLDGKSVEIKRAIPREYNSPSSHLRTKKMFIGGLPSTCTDEDVRSYIDETYVNYGKVVSIELIRDRTTNLVKGFGFIEVDSEDLVDRIIIDNKYPIIGGKKVELKKAEPKEARGRGGGGGPPGGNFRGGRGGGRGGYNRGGGGNPYGGDGNFYGGGGGAYGGNYGGGGGFDGGYQGQGDMYGGGGYGNGGGGYGGGGGGYNGGYGGGVNGGGGYGNGGGGAGGYNNGNPQGSYGQGGGVAPGYGQAGGTAYGQNASGYNQAGGYGAVNSYGGVEGGYAASGGFNDFSQPSGYAAPRGGGGGGVATAPRGGAAAARYKPY